MLDNWKGDPNLWIIEVLDVVDTSRIMKCIIWLETWKMIWNLRARYAVTRYRFYTAVFLAEIQNVTQCPPAFLVCILREICDCVTNPLRCSRDWTHKLGLCSELSLEIVPSSIFTRICVQMFLLRLKTETFISVEVSDLGMWRTPLIPSSDRESDFRYFILRRSLHAEIIASNARVASWITELIRF